MTLRHGVENMLKHYIPEVAGVEAVDADEVPDADDPFMLNSRPIDMPRPHSS